MSLLENEFDVRSVLHGQVSMAAVNQICVIHEAIKVAKKSKDPLKACFENVNITKYHLCKLPFQVTNCLELTFLTPFIYQVRNN